MSKSEDEDVSKSVDSAASPIDVTIVVEDKKVLFDLLDDLSKVIDYNSLIAWRRATVTPDLTSMGQSIAELAKLAATFVTLCAKIDATFSWAPRVSELMVGFYYIAQNLIERECETAETDIRETMADAAYAARERHRRH